MLVTLIGATTQMPRGSWVLNGLRPVPITRCSQIPGTSSCSPPSCISSPAAAVDVGAELEDSLSRCYPKGHSLPERRSLATLSDPGSPPFQVAQ